PCRLLIRLIRRPHSSTLFPYTTLFRSGGGAGTRPLCTGLPCAPGADSPLPRSPISRPALARRGAHGRPAPRRRTERAHQPHRERDRKSTRLNSSHVKISYAVFCLKKKN